MGMLAACFDHKSSLLGTSVVSFRFWGGFLMKAEHAEKGRPCY